MSELNTKQITILFGSGADTDFCGKMPSGAKFAEELVNSKNTDSRIKLLGVHFSSFEIIYPRSKKVFLQTIYENRTEAERAFGEVEDIQNYIDYYQGEKDNKSLSDTVSDDCSEWYRLIKSMPPKTADGKKKKFSGIVGEKTRRFFLGNMVFFDALDERFNSLRHFHGTETGKSGNKQVNANVRRVINAYATIFIYMMKCVYNINEDFEWKYEDIFESIYEKSFDYLDAIKSRVKKPENTYYSITEKYKEECNVVTTNYTDLAERVIKFPGNDVVYLHGNLKWFEDLKELVVYDITDEKDYQRAKDIAKNNVNENRLIPFILIPSGVKPMICEKQIEEFHRFIDMLNNSRYLCTIGYRFNSEDNHINSIIAEWLREDGHTLIFFSYEGNEKTRTDDIKRLSWLEDIIMPSNYQIINGRQQNIGDIDLNVKVVEVIVDGKRCNGKKNITNSEAWFKECLEKLSQEVQND